MRRILVLGAGLAGLWSAVGAARRLAEAAPSSEPVEVMVVDARTFHSIRVRNYEADLEATRVPLADVLDPIGVKWLQGRVQAIDVEARSVHVATADGQQSLAYTRLVFALGSTLVRPDIPGLAEHALDVDTHEGAQRLRTHVQALPQRPDDAARYTAVVIGAGLTGSEIAAELPQRLASVAGAAEHVRVILMDRNVRVAEHMGGAQPVIEQAMRDLGVELRPGVNVRAVTADGVTLDDGEFVAAATVIWCGGMQASALTAAIPAARDAQGRLYVDDYMRVPDVADVYAVGDSANSRIDGRHESIMSCQYGRPMGRFGGHNAATDVLGEPLLPLRVDWYITCVDLGPWGAVYTQGRERLLATQGEQAKNTKRMINCERIYPPRNGDAEAILEAAAPVVDAPPPKLVG